MKRSTAFPAVSLFSGALGLDLGLHHAGFSPLTFVEIDKTCQETIRANLPRLGRADPCSVPILSDITQVSSEQILESCGMDVGEVALLAGGPPCQAFSTAGKRESLSDPRGSLVTKYLEIISEIRPRFFVFENVRGILSAAIRHRPLNRRGAGHPPLSDDERLGSLLAEVILPAFNRLGYEVLYDLVDAADYGVPQRRERVIFLGSRDSEFSAAGYTELRQMMPSTHCSGSSKSLRPWRTLGDALAGLEDSDPEYIAYSKVRADIFRLVPPGKNWRYLRDTQGDEFLREVMGGAYSSSGGRVGFWRRLAFDRPCPTLTTSPVQKATGLCHPQYLRPLSVREYARVQTFPDDWQFAGSTTRRYLQIGNAVPVGLGRAIGEALVKVICTPAAGNLRLSQRALVSC